MKISPSSTVGYAKFNICVKKGGKSSLQNVILFEPLRWRQVKLL